MIQMVGCRTLTSKYGIQSEACPCGKCDR